MTDQIKVPRATWDALREALKKVHYEVINSGVNNYGQLVKHIAKAHDGLTAAETSASMSVMGLSKPTVQPQAQGKEWLSMQQVDRIVYMCREDGQDTTYDIVNSALQFYLDSHPQATEPASCHQTGVCVRSGLAAENHARLIECARRLVEHADFALGGILSADSKAKDIPSKAVSQVKSRHLAALRDALPAAPEAKQ